MADEKRQRGLFDDGADTPAPAPARPAPEPPPPPEPAPALTVSAFNERVGSFLKGLFPGRFRIQGFVSGFDRSWARGSHVYFDLLEKDPADESSVLSQASMVLWRGARGRLTRALAELGQSLDDQQVFFEVTLNYYVPRGRLSLVVEDLDLEASLGAQRLDRERLLRLLAAEGLLKRNARLPLAAVPLRLALVTSVESAAYHDFIKELGLAGVAFRLTCIDARVQGSEQEASLRAAFAWIARNAADYDAVVLIRGGGSRSDLAGFDAEPLARDIAACPLPVLTGIGHEIDRAVADEVAHRAFKTPTAVAQFLVQRVEQWLERLETQAEAVQRAAEKQLVAEGRRLEQRARALGDAAGRLLRARRERLGEVAAALPLLARQTLRMAGLRLRHARSGLSPARLAAATVGARRRVDASVQRLGLAAGGLVARQGKELAHREERLRLLDPQQVLQRGFSLTRDASGRLLRDPAGLKAGDRIVTTLAAGSLESTLSAATPTKGERE
ncbi:MAG: exodeoxyribonuclease VII large subunit [Candidatus Krumholzibacteriia bacterium]